MSDKNPTDGADKMAFVRLDGRAGSQPGYLNAFLQEFAEVDGHVVPIDGQQVDVLDLNAAHLHCGTPAALASLSSDTESSGQLTGAVQQICAKPISAEAQLRHVLSLWKAAGLPFHRDSHPAVVVGSDAHSLLLRLLANPNCDEQKEGTATKQLPSVKSIPIASSRAPRLKLPSAWCWAVGDVVSTADKATTLTLDSAYRVARDLAYHAEMLYYIVVSPAARWCAGDPPGDLERDVFDLSQRCGKECEPFLSTLRCLYALEGVQGWDRREACGVDVVLGFSRRVLMQAARLRGEPMADEFGFPRFEELPAKQRGWLTSLIEQEFALLHRRPNASVPLSASDGERDFMELAVKEARKSVGEDGRAHPKVGAVVVKGGIVVASAHRGEMGKGEHAEYTALERKLHEDSIAGATIYTTLEPCTTRKLPKIPCAERLVKRKVKRVVIGMLDPNPAIRGNGVLLLREHNIEVALFQPDLMAVIEELNRDFSSAHSQPTTGK